MRIDEELLKTSTFPPKGESYWLDVEKLVEEKAGKFIADHPGLSLTFKKHSDAPRWFLIEKEANDKPTKRIQITLRGEPGKFILSLMPDAIRVREGRHLTLPSVYPPKFAQVVRLKGGVEWQKIEALDDLGLALESAIKDAAYLAEQEESDFSVPLPG